MMKGRSMDDRTIDWLQNSLKKNQPSCLGRGLTSNTDWALEREITEDPDLDPLDWVVS